MTGLPDGQAADVADTGSGSAPAADLEFASNVYSMGPSGPLNAPVHITVPLTEPVSSNTAVVAATREDESQPWEYLPATLNADGTTASFDTTHFSLFGILGYDVAKVFEQFRRDFIDTLSGGATQTDVPRPACDHEQEARADGYHITSSSTDAVYWCLGLDGGGRRVLKVTNHRRYPLQMVHPNMTTLTNPHDYLALSSLSRRASGGYAIVAPGVMATFDADLNLGGSEGIATEMDGFGQSLYALQTGLETLASILTRFGAREWADESNVLRAFDTVVQSRACADSLDKGSGGYIAGCFSPAQLLTAFGAKAVLLVPLMVFGPLMTFFRSEWNAFFDQFNHRDQYRIDITRDAAPPAAVGLNTFAFISDWVGSVTVPGALGGRYDPIAMQVGSTYNPPPPAGPLTGDFVIRGRDCGGFWDEVSHNDTAVTAHLTMDASSRAAGCPAVDTLTMRLDSGDNLHVDGGDWSAILERVPD